MATTDRGLHSEEFNPNLVLNEELFSGGIPLTLPASRRYRADRLFFKRLIDLVITSAALIVALPVMVIVAIVIKIDSPGPVLYRSRRVGRRGIYFECYKFRTMVDGAHSMRASIEHLNERDEVLFKVTDDPRITRIGRWLRKYSFDELPQLINVLRGDMSLIGPRPALPEECVNYSTVQMRRLDVKPGITGLWQVMARQDPSFETYVAFDLEYIRRWSLSLDLIILCKTVSAVLRGTGS